MKKIVIISLIFLVSYCFSSCNIIKQTELSYLEENIYEDNTPVTGNYLPSIKINDTLYYTIYSFSFVDAPDSSLICGTVTSYTDIGYPIKHEQTNDIVFLDQPYAIIGDTLIVQINYRLYTGDNSSNIEKWIKLNKTH